MEDVRLTEALVVHWEIQLTCNKIQFLKLLTARSGYLWSTVDRNVVKW
jgi:hypothetical protein